MYFCCAVAGNIARRAAMGTLLRNSARCRLLSACGSHSGQISFMRNLQTRPTSKQLPEGEQDWTPDDLKIVPDPNENENSALEAEKWIQVYKFRYIVYLRTIIRFKMHATALFLVGTPAVFLLPQLSSQLQLEAKLIFTAFSLYSVLVSVLLGHVTQKAVGILYVNDAGNKIRVARLSFWAKRTDSIYDLDDIMRTQDQGHPTTLPAILLTKFSDPKDQSYIFHKHGIVDQELFEYIFGAIPESEKKEKTKFER